jgi:hypothetical protein
VFPRSDGIDFIESLLRIGRSNKIGESNIKTMILFDVSDLLLR